MSNIVFFGFIAHGHTNPTLNLVQALTQAGHQVRYYSFEPFRQAITEAGAEFIPCDAFLSQLNLSPKDTARIGRDLVFSAKLLVDTTLALDDMVLEEMERFRPNCIVADSMALWGKAVAKKLDIPFVCSTTTFAFNKQAAKAMRQEGPGLFTILKSMGKVQQEVKRLQDRGYPIKNILDILQNDDTVDTIVYTSPGFQPCANTFSNHVTFVGPSIRPAQSTFEKTREKLVYISMGTVNNNLMELYQSCIQAFRLKPYQVVISVGDQTDLSQFGQLPEHIQVCHHVDQIAVLEKADLFVSHCGMNSVSESLYHGVPLVVLPQTDEQRAVAHQVLRFYAGLEPVQPNGDCILAAAETVMDDINFYINAKILARGFNQCPGTSGAVEKILSVCKN